MKIVRIDRHTRSGAWIAVALGLVLAGVFAASTGAATFEPKAGQIVTKDIGGVKFHTYVTAGVSDHVIETPRSLILVDVGQVKANNDELRAFIASLHKPLTRIYISHDHAHHWIGLPDFPNVPIHALPQVITFMKEKGPEELERARQRMGQGVMPYNWVMAGHGVPLEGRAYFAKAIDYYATLAKAIAETTDPAAAKARMKAAFPDYAGDALLDRMLPGFFKK